MAPGVVGTAAETLTSPVCGPLLNQISVVCFRRLLVGIVCWRCSRRLSRGPTSLRRSPEAICATGIGGQEEAEGRKGARGALPTQSQMV